MRCYAKYQRTLYIYVQMCEWYKGGGCCRSSPAWEMSSHSLCADTALRAVDMQCVSTYVEQPVGSCMQYKHFC